MQAFKTEVCDGDYFSSSESFSTAGPCAAAKQPGASDVEMGDIRDLEEQICSICLDSMYNSDSTKFVGQITNCKHFYHDCCIKEWSERSNSCPTCRKLYYQIDVVSKTEGIIESIKIQDKLLPNDAINSIPEEFIIPSNQDIYNELDDQHEGYSGEYSSCILCDNHSLVSNFVVCEGCSGYFHVNCLGFVSGVLEWCCPLCDNTQELSSSRTNQVSRRRRRRNLVDRNSRITNDFFTQHFRRSPTRRINVRKANIRTNSTLHRHSNVTDYIPPTPKVEASSELTMDELTAWEQLEKLKNNDDICLSSSSATMLENVSKEAEPKKLKRPSRRNRSESDNGSSSICHQESPSVLFSSTMKPSSSSSKPSITSLISEIKNNSKQLKKPKFQSSLPPVNMMFGQLSPPISPTQPMAQLVSPLCLSQPFSTLSSSSSSSLNWGSSINNIPNNCELSYENKKIIQHYIREKLRPLYTSNLINTDQYTEVNKLVSRKLYTLIQNENKIDLVNSDDSIKKAELVDMVAEFVDLELQDL